jgi:hypothetical protein
MTKFWPLLVFVSLKYCAEKKLIKTRVAFFYEETVYEKSLKSENICTLATFYV